MGLSYKQSSVPTTLNEGEFAVVDGVTYVGNSSNEPVEVGANPLSGEEYLYFWIYGSDSGIEVINEYKNTLTSFEISSYSNITSTSFQINLSQTINDADIIAETLMFDDTNQSPLSSSPNITTVQAGTMSSFKILHDSIDTSQGNFWGMLIKITYFTPDA